MAIEKGLTLWYLRRRVVSSSALSFEGQMLNYLKYFLSLRNQRYHSIKLVLTGWSAMNGLGFRSQTEALCAAWFSLQGFKMLRWSWTIFYGCWGTAKRAWSPRLGQGESKSGDLQQDNPVSVNWVLLVLHAWTKGVEGHYQTGSETGRSLVWMREGRGEEFS